MEGAFPRHVTLQDYAASEGVEIILQQKFDDLLRQGLSDCPLSADFLQI